MCMFVKSVRCHASIRNALAKVSCKATKKSTNRHCQSPICFSFTLEKTYANSIPCFRQNEMPKKNSRNAYWMNSSAEQILQNGVSGSCYARYWFSNYPCGIAIEVMEDLKRILSDYWLEFEHLHAFARFILTMKTSSRSIFPQEACPNAKKNKDFKNAKGSQGIVR